MCSATEGGAGLLGTWPTLPPELELDPPEEDGAEDFFEPCLEDDFVELLGVEVGADV
jgi:hypothetical protein